MSDWRLIFLQVRVQDQDTRSRIVRCALGDHGDGNECSTSIVNKSCTSNFNGTIEWLNNRSSAFPLSHSFGLSSDHHLGQGLFLPHWSMTYKLCRDGVLTLRVAITYIYIILPGRPGCTEQAGQ